MVGYHLLLGSGLVMRTNNYIADAINSDFYSRRLKPM